MKVINTLSLVLSFNFICLNIFAQINQGGTPRSFRYTFDETVHTVTMPNIDLRQLQQEDSIYAVQGGYPWRFAHPFEVQLNLKNSGTWTTLSNGDRIWRLNIHCPGAQSINLLYDQFHLPAGGLFYLYDQNKDQTLGAYTAANNKASGKFGTELLYDDFITLEYYEPAWVKSESQISIAMIAHGYRSFNHNARNLGSSGSCQVNVNCSPEGDDWQDEKKGVAKIIIDGTGLCSGSLVNTTNNDCTPYFLTADHCIGSLDAVSNTDASGWVFYWNYERSGCNNTGSVPSQSTTGATLLANDAPSDFALFLLAENPSDSYDVYYNGWNATDSPGTSGVGIHHPSGDAKKISTHTMVPAHDDWFGGTPNSHWLVSWDATTNGQAITEGGSSGSPLFDQNSRVIGQLHGGSSINCTDPNNDPGIYGKIYYSWENNGTTLTQRRLKDWLDPVGGGRASSVDGRYCTSTSEVIFSSFSSVVNESEADIENGCLDYIEFPVRVQVLAAPSVAATLTFSTSGSASEGSTLDYEITPSQITLDAGNLSQNITVRIYNDAYPENDENFTISYTLNANGGNAVAGSINQTHTVTISDDDITPENVSTQSTLLSEDFNASATGWTVTDGGSTTDTWGLYGYYGSNFGDNLNGSTMALVDSDAAGSGSTSYETLTSPTFDATGYDTLKLEFEQKFLIYSGSYNESANVEVWDGSAWQNVYQQTESDGNLGAWAAPNQQSIDITSYANAALQVRFIFDAAYDYYWAIDNVSIVGSNSISTQSSVNTSSGTEQYLGPNTTVHFYDAATDNIMLSIENTSSHDFGCTTVTVDREDTGSTTEMFTMSDVGYYLHSRTFKISPTTNNTSADYKVTLYYSNTEITAWETATGNSRNDLDIVKVAGDNAIDLVTPVNYATFDIESASTTLGNVGNSSISLTTTFSSGFSGFGIGLKPTNILPVELISFYGKHEKNKGNHLFWQTASEINHAYFEVQRSFDGTLFKPIASIRGTGDSDEMKEYDFMDVDGQSGLHYYRLKQVDFDGVFEYSKIVVINTASQSIRIYPNPIQNVLQVEFDAAPRSNVDLSIFNHLGQSVKTMSFLQVDNPSLSVDTNDLSPGAYFVSIQYGNERVYYKIIKK